MDYEDTFWNKVEKRGPDECWLWTGKLNDQGYGQVYMPKRAGRPRAHRVAFALANNREVESLGYILHSCDNPPCVNPNHLREGTQKQNAADMMTRGRHGRTILTEAQVIEARERAGYENMHDIICDLGAPQDVIKRAVTGETWGHLPGALTVYDLDWSKTKDGLKLNQDQVIEILTSLEKKYHGQQKYLAEKYGVSRTVIRQIGLGNIYKHAWAEYHNLLACA